MNFRRILFRAIVYIIILGFANKFVFVNSEVTCQTNGCKIAAKFISEAIDFSVNPCDDFYQFACGNWQRKNPTPADMSQYDVFTQIKGNVYNQLKGLLENDSVLHTSKSTDTMKRIYRKCMNITEINTLKSGSLIEGILSNYGWPLLGVKNINQQGAVDITELLGRLRRDYGLEVFFSVYVNFDFENSSNNILWVSAQALTDNQAAATMKDTFLKRHVQPNVSNNANADRLYNNYLQLIATDLGLKITPQIKTEFDKIVSFHRRLLKMANGNYDSDSYDVKMTISELQDVVPFINWYRYFEIIMPDNVYKFFKRQPNLLVNVHTTVYMELLQRTFKTYNSTVMLQNYIIWRLVKFWVPYLDLRFTDAFLDFTQNQFDQRAKPARWEDCISAIEKKIGFALSVLYLRHYFDDATKAEALAIVEQLKEAFKIILKNLDWMDSSTKSYALEKISYLIVHIGYNAEMTSDAYVDEYYKNINISQSDNYFTMMRKLSVWKFYDEFNSLLTPYDRSVPNFDEAITQVNANYRQTNEMTINPPMLLQPFFNKDFPNAVNYAGIGFVIGHEFTHGFDTSGRLFDKRGNLKDWWTEYSLENYRAKIACIRRLYNKVDVTEDIADIGGIKIAFEAHKAVSAKRFEEGKLPGLEKFTNDQIFFLSYASTWCGNINPKFAANLLLTDEHSLRKTRVTLTLSNYNEFARAFQCSNGSRMNPVGTRRNIQRCTMWDDNNKKLFV